MGNDQIIDVMALRFNIELETSGFRERDIPSTRFISDCDEIKSWLAKPVMQFGFVRFDDEPQVIRIVHFSSPDATKKAISGDLFHFLPDFICV